eukprot:TRINITY_DN8964_c0_g1_i3.p1 TRINITY_DN8964_c0_g1~~TRINITY_DN8964_c0_g1_i3.p1  ORF type:complete len:885 (+),score=359.86 TRINITY_DN8964_c0_g1_i3:221-2875(+)
MQKRLNGLITGVLSGDHLLIQGRERGEEAPSNKDIYLAFIEAAKMGSPQREAEAFGLTAREYVRKLLIGKRVSFIPEYKYEDKDYATIWVEEEKGEVDVAAELVRNGLAKLRGREEKNESRWDELKELQEEAKDKEIGMWAEEEERAKNVTRILFSGMPGYSMENVFAGVKKEGKTQGIVEYQLATNSYNILIIKYKTVVKVMLDYLINLPGGSKATAQQQELSKRARAFADRAVMSKEVTVVMDRYDPEVSVISGKILLPTGEDLAAELLANGYAKLKFQAAGMDEKYYASLRVALNQAQVQRKGMWKSTEVKSEGTKAKYTAQVVEVNSGDSITVVKSGGSEEMRLFLAGVRAPKIGTQREESKGEPFGWEAKEFLRKLLIGKLVEIDVEYTRVPKQDEKSTVAKRPMTFVNVITPETKCANVEVAAAGLVTVLTPRLDEQLSQYFQQIADAAAKAKKEKKGIHFSGQTPPTHSYQSLLGQVSPKMVAYYQELFRKTPNVNGVVEYCFTGSRFKVRVDQMNCYIPFICQGLQPIQQDPNVPELQTIFAQGQKFAKNMVLQRDVKLSINSNDRKGNFFGTLLIGGKDYATELLEEGLTGLKKSGGRGHLSSYSQKKDKYEEAEEVAKKAKKGIWNPKNSIVLDLIFSEANEFEDIEGKDKVEIVKCVNNRYFYASLVDESITKKTEAAVASSFNLTKAEKLLPPIRSGTYCMALYSEDGKWYRGQVERMVSESTYEVLFLDYGNTENANIKNIRKINLGLIKEHPPCAFKLGLAYLDMPPLDFKVGEKTLRSILNNQLESREITVIYKYKEGGVRYGIIMDGDGTDYMKSFNAYLVKNGLAMLSTETDLPEALKEWADMQSEAQQEPRGFWETGQFNESQDYE